MLIETLERSYLFSDLFVLRNLSLSSSSFPLESVTSGIHSAGGARKRRRSATGVFFEAPQAEKYIKNNLHKKYKQCAQHSFLFIHVCTDAPSPRRDVGGKIYMIYKK